MANGKPGVKSEHWAQESPATSWKQGSRERHCSSLVHGLLFLHRLILRPETEKHDMSQGGDCDPARPSQQQGTFGQGQLPELHRSLPAVPVLPASPRPSGTPAEPW